MSTFWGASNKIPVKQTSTAISSVNGLSYSPGQVVHIDIPPSVKFIQPKESWLQFDFKISNPVNGSDGTTRLQLDGQIGAQSLIRDIRVYSSTENGGVLLEEIQGYNSMVSVKYDYDTDDNLKNKRAVAGEGSTTHKPETRGTLGTQKSMVADIKTNPYFVSSETGTHQTAFTNSSFTTAKMCIPLHTGIWGSNKVFPNLLTGCRIEIILESADRCLRQLDSVLRGNKVLLNPRFDSVNGSQSGGKTGLAQGSTLTSFYITNENNNLTPEQCPFVVGELVGFCDANGCQTTSSVFTAVDGISCPRITRINASASASNNAGLVQITCDPPLDLASATTIVPEGFFVYSESVDTVDNGTFAPSYLVSNVEMVVQELDMGSQYENSMRKSMSEGGNIAYDILTATNYRYSQLSSDIVANIRLPLNESRAKSIICVPTDATNYTAQQRIFPNITYDVSASLTGDGTSLSTRSGFVGISDNVQSYQFYYGSPAKLQPSRLVSTAKISSKNSIDAQPIIENEKALVQAGISARSFSCYNSNYILSRALSLNNGVYDARNKDFNLQVNYGLASKNKLWNNFVFSLRRINIRGDSINIVV